MNMRKIEELSAEMISKISALKEHALNGVSNGKRYENFNSVNAFKCINWNYNTCGYRSPVLIVTENPLEMQMMFNFVKALDGGSRFSNSEAFPAILHEQLAHQLAAQPQPKTPLGVRLRSIQRSKLGSRASSNLDSNFLHDLDKQLYAQLYSKMFLQLDTRLSSELRSELGRMLHSELRFMLGDQLGQALDDEIDTALSKQIMGLGHKHSSHLFTTNFYSDCIYAWYEFLRNELRLNIGIDNELHECFELQNSSGICQAIYSEELCVISKYPKRVHWNKKDQLHNEFSSAIKWGSYSDFTKFECSFINGTAASPLSNSSPLKMRLVNQSNEPSWGNYTPFPKIA